MQESKKTYNAADLAGIFNIHPNTVRLYEKLGFISEAQRNANSYRIFKELHLLQIKVCRCIFGYPFTNTRVRNAGNDIMWATAKKQWNNARRLTDTYIQIIEEEIIKARKASEMLQIWASSAFEIPESDIMLSRKEAADILGVTVESVRNWERNNLILSRGAGIKGETLYSSTDLGRMHVIYMLLQTGYSMAAIHRSLSMYEKGRAELVISALNDPKHDELVSVGDNWLKELNKLLNAAREIPSLTEAMEKL